MENDNVTLLFPFTYATMCPVLRLAANFINLENIPKSTNF